MSLTTPPNAPSTDAAPRWTTACPALLHKIATVHTQQLLAEGAPEPVCSPCVSVCRMDAANHHCVGCLRTLNELCAWGQADAPARRAIWAQVLERAALAPATDAAA